MTRVRERDSHSGEIGEVLWHSIDENGEVGHYDVEWPTRGVQRGIPAALLEKVSDDDVRHHSHKEEKRHTKTIKNEDIDKKIYLKLLEFMKKDT